MFIAGRWIKGSVYPKYKKTLLPVDFCLHPNAMEVSRISFVVLRAIKNVIWRVKTTQDKPLSLVFTSFL